MLSICVKMMCKRINNVGEGISSMNDESSMWCGLWNLFQIAYVAKLLSDVKFMLLVSWCIEYECIKLYVMCYMLLVEYLNS